MSNHYMWKGEAVGDSDPSLRRKERPDPFASDPLARCPYCRSYNVKGVPGPDLCDGLDHYECLNPECTEAFACEEGTDIFWSPHL